MSRKQKKLISAAKIFALLVILILIAVPAGGLEALPGEEKAETYYKFLDHNPYISCKIKPGTQKAVYITGYSAGLKEKRQEIYRLIGQTELNSIVFDVKDDWGYVCYDTDVEMAKEIGAVRGYYDLEQLIAEMSARGIYGIARFVLFKDRILPEAKPEFAIKDSRTGKPIRLEGSYWPDIYCEEVLDYYIELVKELASRGVKEIQFDYIRAPAKGNLSYASYTYNDSNKTKVEAITDFLKRVKEETKYFDIKISADVFGWVFIANNDQGIGQMLEEMVPYLDYIYPMPYPSHYSANFLGYSLPEEHPYEVVSYTLKKGLARIGGVDCKVIPWIQTFSIQKKYTENEILAQIRAAEDLGIEGYLCWNAANIYKNVERAMNIRKNNQ